MRRGWTSKDGSGWVGPTDPVSVAMRENRWARQDHKALRESTAAECRLSHPHLTPAQIRQWVTKRIGPAPK